MIPGFNRKLVNLMPPAALLADTASATIAYVDTLGFSYLIVDVICGAMGDVTTLFELTECDTSGGTYTAITPSVFGTANNDTGVASTFPTTTDGNHLFSWFVDLRGTRKRFIQPAITNGGSSSGNYFTVIAELYWAANAPQTAAQAGLAQRIMF
jgi:hypothetical protein